MVDPFPDRPGPALFDQGVTNRMRCYRIEMDEFFGGYAPKVQVGGHVQRTVYLVNVFQDKPLVNPPCMRTPSQAAVSKPHESHTRKRGQLGLIDGLPDEPSDEACQTSPPPLRN